MNNKSQVIFYTLMLGITIIVLVLALAYPVKEQTDQVRIDLNCTNATISDYDKGACLETDLTMPYFILGCLGIGFAVIGARIVFGE